MNLRTYMIAAAALLIGMFAGVEAQNATAPSKPALTQAVSTIADNGNKSCDGVDCVIKAVQDAKQSGDTKKMKSALDLAEKQLTDAKGHFTKAVRIAQKLQEHMDKIDAQRTKVKAEQQKLDALEYPTDQFIID